MKETLLYWHYKFCWAEIEKKHLIVTNVRRYRNIKQIFWYLLLAVQCRAYLKLRHMLIFIYILNLNVLLWGLHSLKHLAYQIWYKLSIQVSDHSITSGSCCKQTDMDGVKLQMDMSLIRINGPWGSWKHPISDRNWTHLMQAGVITGDFWLYLLNSVTQNSYITCFDNQPIKPYCF